MSDSRLFATKTIDSLKAENAQLKFQNNQLQQQLCATNKLGIFSQDATEQLKVHFSSAPFDIRFIKDLLIKKADPNCYLHNGKTPLIELISSNDYEQAIAELLIEHGADVNKLSSTGLAPLHYAVHSSVGRVKFLLTRNADPFITNLNGKTPLEHYKKCQQYMLNFSDSDPIVLALQNHTVSKRPGLA